MSTGNRPRLRTGAVIVAAGMSSRMKSFKPMLPLAASTVIRTLIGTLQQAGVVPIIVITGRNSAELTRHIADLPVTTIENVNYAKTDMFYSACLGLNAIRDQVERVFFLPGDVPLFSRYSLATMSEYLDENPCDILIPAYNGRQGHPVLIKSSIIDELTEFRGPGGLRAAIKNYGGKKSRIALPDQGLVLDADNPEDYLRLTEYLAASARQMPLACAASITLSKSEAFFDEALASLLALTEQNGSLTKACKLLGISYSCGWKNVRLAEEQLGFILLKSNRGGLGGGGSCLTQQGRRFLAAYRRLLNSVSKFSAKQFAKYFAEISNQ